ncbi:hypothetical protein [Azospirillum palustre]
MRHSHLPSKLRAVVTGGRGQGGNGAAGAGRQGGPFACGTSDWHFKDLALPEDCLRIGRRRTGAGKRIWPGAGGAPASDFRCSTRTARLSMEKRGGKQSRADCGSNRCVDKPHRCADGLSNPVQPFSPYD